MWERTEALPLGGLAEKLGDDAQAVPAVASEDGRERLFAQVQRLCEAHGHISVYRARHTPQ